MPDTHLQETLLARASLWAEARSLPKIFSRFVLGAVAFLAIPCPARAAFPGVQSSQGWVDANGDGKADWCMQWGDDALQCTPSTGNGFGARFRTTHQDPGYGAGRAWVDFNGDGRADYCRVVGGSYKNLQCTVSLGDRFGATFTSGNVDPGYDAGRAWVDVNGDGKADYCRVVGAFDKRLECTLSTGDGFGASFRSGVIDPGYDNGRAWVDVNGDGKADYCRVVGLGSKSVQCTLTTGSGFGQTFTSGAIDPGYDDFRFWADVNGDGKADYCRKVGLGPNSIQCTLSNGTTFGNTFASPAMDTGYKGGAWADVNGDGKADYCRPIGGPAVQCTFSTGQAFGSTITQQLNPPSFAQTEGWVDANGDGRADYCRAVARDQLACTLSTGTGFGQTFTGGL
jgi:hypothetical protein